MAAREDDILGDGDNKWIGKSTIRPDGEDKVTGRATFGADFTQPGMLWGKVLRSPHPHAHIKSINVDAASALPGVKAVMTGADLVDFPLDTPVMVGPADLRFVSRNVMARDKALYAGHAVAAVAATSPTIAAQSVGPHRGRVRGAALGHRCRGSDASRCPGSARLHSHRRNRSGAGSAIQRRQPH